jgi:hypothetical protein
MVFLGGLSLLLMVAAVWYWVAAVNTQHDQRIIAAYMSKHCGHKTVSYDYTFEND